jgi:hypothetical protein
LQQGERPKGKHHQRQQAETQTGARGNIETTDIHDSGSFQKRCISLQRVALEGIGIALKLRKTKRR